MMKNEKYKIVTLFVTLSLMFASCREDSDYVPYYGSNDSSNFSDANTSLTGQFKAFWVAMNCNYPLWDYEEDFGMDWDAVYKKYLPIFERYDQRYAQEGIPVSNTELKSVYSEIMSPLHDGHIKMDLRNIHTGTDIIHVNPQYIRNSSREDYSDYFLMSYTHKYYWTDPEHKNEVVDGDTDAFSEYLRFTDNILYYHLEDQFNYLVLSSEKDIWSKWFNAIQDLHKNNQLKGIIIDLRNNGGGNSDYYKYVLGALQEPSEELDNLYLLGEVRLKDGIGRHDFNIIFQYSLPLYKGKREYIRKEPIVILTNWWTASLAEHTCLIGKKLSNVCIIGMTTYGAYSPLLGEEKDYSSYYSGSVGNVSDFNSGKCSFYISMPYSAFLYEGKILEGFGVEPDIEIPFDEDLYRSTGRDNQLERALEYIRAGQVVQ